MASATAGSLDVRADFPILAREIDGRRLVYLDSGVDLAEAAAVLAALDDYYRNHNANIHRGVYPLAQEADAAFRGRARADRRVRRLAGRGRRSSRATSTEAINLVAYSWARANLRRRRRGADHADGAPLEHRPVAAGDRRRPARRCAT